MSDSIDNSTAASKRKVLLLFCGGTISMSKDAKTGALDVAHGADQFFKIEPRIVEIAQIDVRFVDNLDSTDMIHRQWERMVDIIDEEYKNYDGFLITMGTNTMAYASSAVSFALTGIGKPVVFTGAQIPAEVISTDGRNNLVNALRVAAMDLGGVFLVFGSKIILGCRAKKYSESDLDAFKTFNDSDFAEISIGIKINKEGYDRHDRPFKAKNGFEDNIACFTCIPGLRNEHLIALIEGGIKGIILRAFGSGDVPHELLPALRRAREKKIPVVITTQCPGGATVMGLNDPGLQALRQGKVIQAFDMCMEAMSTKLMWLLKQGIPYEELRDNMQKSLCGEVSTKRVKVFLNQELQKDKEYQRKLDDHSEKQKS